MDATRRPSRPHSPVRPVQRGLSRPAARLVHAGHAAPRALPLPPVLQADADDSALRPPHARLPVTRRRLLLAAGGLAAIALVVSGLVWVKSYAPLSATAVAPRLAVSTRPAHDDGELDLAVDGKRDRFAEASICVRNTGRWAVTIDSAGEDFGGCLPVTKEERKGTGTCSEVVGVSSDGGRHRQFRSVRVPSGGTVELRPRIEGVCWGHGPGTMGTSFERFRLHYSYLGIFGRSAWVDWPAYVSFVCRNPAT